MLAGLGIGADDRVSLAGASLGGWMAVDYATRRPGRVERLALLCPGGIGAQKRGFLFKALALMMLGRWGRRRALELAMGATPGAEGPDDEAFMAFAILTFTHFRPRRKPLPVFGDDALRGLTMPTLVIVGGRDVMLDSADTRRRVEATMPHARVVFLPETGHGLRAQTARILSFLLDPAPAGPPGTPAG
ncbi:alpha/beta fold hydrolase [Thermocatellispora tengchongensis]|uniref:alpha/beta fold hydrolase n=1 Tax=Thermocatellispora tengchongensis TaxID=1073253 RepID=UPI003636B9BD